MHGKIEVLVFVPGKNPEFRFIGYSLESMQKLVEGYIEVLAMAPSLLIETGENISGLFVVCNEDGRLLKKPDNRFGLCGTFFIARMVGNDIRSLTAKDKLALSNLFTVWGAVEPSIDTLN